MVQEAYNEFKRELNQLSPGYTFVLQIRKHEIKLGQPDRTPPMQKEKGEKKYSIHL
jgi:hypothetical protein